METIQTIKKRINRQRNAPKIWDFSYFLLKNSHQVFDQFSNLIIYGSEKIKILDVGCGFKPWQSAFDTDKISYIGVDFDLEKSSADVVAPADKLPFPDNSFDALIYSEILEHVDNLPGTLSEMRRVAKSGALIYITTPFMFPEHGIPHDYQRLTRYFYEKQFGSELVLLRESNGSFSSALAGLNLFIESTPFRIFFGIKNIFYTIINILGLVGDSVPNFVFSRIWKKYRKYFYLMPMGYAAIVRIKK